MRRDTTTARRGWSLIELLVVIAILATLMGLTIAAVMRFYIKGPELNTRSELSQMTAGIQSFETKYSVDYVPSRIVLREQLNYDPNDQLEMESYAYLKRVFGRNLRGRSLVGGVGVDWNGDGQLNTAPVRLTGPECLVFFLGGVPKISGATRGCGGFSTDPVDPTAPGGDRAGPFFNFKSSRLRGTQGNFSVYLDPFEAQPYVFFSSYKSPDGYLRYTNIYGDSDCAAQGVSAYHQPGAGAPPVRYHNPETFQIISAGKDKAFGPGGLWPPAQGAGADDMSNFHPRILGAN